MAARLGIFRNDGAARFEAWAYDPESGSRLLGTLDYSASPEALATWAAWVWWVHGVTLPPPPGLEAERDQPLTLPPGENPDLNPADRLAMAEALLRDAAGDVERLSVRIALLAVEARAAGAEGVADRAMLLSTAAVQIALALARGAR